MRNQKRRGLVELAEVGRGEDQVHAGQRARRATRRSRMRAVRVWAAEARRVEHPRRVHVVDEAAEPPEEPRILVARDARADHARRHGLEALSAGARRAASSAPARRTARTMFTYPVHRQRLPDSQTRISSSLGRGDSSSSALTVIRMPGVQKPH